MEERTICRECKWHAMDYDADFMLIIKCGNPKRSSSPIVNYNYTCGFAEAACYASNDTSDDTDAWSWAGK